MKHNEQQGEALLVGVLLLTAVTIFGVVGLKTSNLEERIFRQPETADRSDDGRRVRCQHREVSA